MSIPLFWKIVYTIGKHTILQQNFRLGYGLVLVLGYGLGYRLGLGLWLGFWLEYGLALVAI